MKSGKSKIKLLIMFIVLVFILIGVMFFWYTNSLKPVSKESTLVKVTIPEGTGLAGISEILKESNVIKNANAMKIYSKINNVGSLKAGNYELDSSESMPTIVEHIVQGDIYSNEIKITFIEGKNMRWIAKKIAECTNNTEDDVFNLLNDDEYIDSLINKYWFLTDEIKDDNIYYPLEGYLLPDTYTFEDKDVSVETIFNTLLNYMDKYLQDFKNTDMPHNLTIHQMLTMASIAELEGKTYDDRAEIVGVFFNRVFKKMSLGSDVTTYYAFKVDMGERDLTSKELDTENPYNTRGPNMAGKIPIGPICNPSKSAIESTINYKETDAYYFVADKTGKVYFTKTNDEHNKMINTLKSEGLWYTYNN